LHDHAVQIRIEKTYSARLVEKKLYIKIPISAVSFVTPQVAGKKKKKLIVKKDDRVKK
jgi:hypothetical protein